MTTKPKTRKAAPKAAAPISPADYEEIRKRVEAESEEALRVESDAFLTLFADWLAARADHERPHEDSDEDDEARLNRVEKLASK